MKFIERHTKEFGIKRVQYLPVSGAFHTNLMLNAKQSVGKALTDINIHDPVIPVHSNVNAFKYKSSLTIAKLLPQQICKPVKWEQILHVVYSRPQGERFPHTFEVGPGHNLGSILRKTNQKAYEYYSNIEV